jgi:amino acid transporter
VNVLKANVQMRVIVILYAISLMASFMFFLVSDSHRHPFGGFYDSEESSFYARWAFAFFMFSFVLSFFIFPKPKWALNIYLKLMIYIVWFALVCGVNLFIYVYLGRASYIACSFLRCGLDWGVPLP